MEVYFNHMLQVRNIPAFTGETFDTCALLFGGYARFIPLDKMVFYGYWKAISSGGLLTLHIALTLFPFFNRLCCSIFNYYVNNFNSVLQYVCF